jgi:hypothetical protein
MFRALANGLGYFPGLPNAHTDLALAVSYHYNSAEAEPTSTLHNLGRAGDMDHSFVILHLLERATARPSIHR